MIRINVFGPTVVINGETRIGVTELGGVKPRQLLEMLATDLGTPLSKDWLAERLWEESPPSSYIATLESYVCVLRKHAQLGHGRHAPLSTTTRGYLLDPDQVSVDLVDTQALLRSRDVASVLRGLEIASAPLLPEDTYASWAMEIREEHASLVTDACLNASRVSLLAGNEQLALRFAREAAAHSYLNEPVARELMRSLARCGEPGEALQVYLRLRADMLAELGVEPGHDTEREYLEILGRNAEHTPSSLEEIRTLLRLIRAAVESAGEFTRHDAEMREVGHLLLAHSG